MCYFEIIIFHLVFSSTYLQYVFSNDTIPKEISLHNHTTIADVGQRSLDIQYVVANYNFLNTIKLVTENDDLGFTQNNFWSKTKIINLTNSKLNYYLETARPMTDLVALFIVDVASGKITTKISGDNTVYS